MKVNGESVTLEESQNISSIIFKRGYSVERVAVVLNGQIVPKEKYGNIILCDSDKIEVISFVGGG